MKLKQYSNKYPCYYCGALGPSIREHVPPKMMFCGFDTDSITVPSCDKHNTEKSIGDRAVITAIIMSASQMLNNLDKLNVQLTSNVITAIKLVEPNIPKAKNEVELRDILIDPPEGLDIQIPYTQPGANIYGWMRQLSAALVWSVIGLYEPDIQWDNALAWSPGFLPIAEPITSEKAASLLGDYHDLEKREFDKLSWRPGWSAAPKNYPADIYSFEIGFPKDRQDLLDMNVVFRHRFYNSTSVWYVMFKAPQEIVDVLVTSID
jgi:hypothetical protein